MSRVAEMTTSAVTNRGRVAKSSEAERKERMDTSSLMEQILSSDNLNRAYLQVVRNKGAEGVDGMKYTELKEHLEKNGDIMAIGDSGILATGKGIEDITFESLKKIVEDDTEIISIYYGKDVSEEDAEKLRDRAAEAFTSCDVELQYGGQPIYYYILSAE